MNTQSTPVKQPFHKGWLAAIVFAALILLLGIVTHSFVVVSVALVLGIIALIALIAQRTTELSQGERRATNGVLLSLTLFALAFTAFVPLTDQSSGSTTAPSSTVRTSTTSTPTITPDPVPATAETTTPPPPPKTTTMTKTVTRQAPPPFPVDPTTPPTPPTTTPVTTTPPPPHEPPFPVPSSANAPVVGTTSDVSVTTAAAVS